MSHESKIQKEIAPLNKEFLSFDLKDLTLEELDNRLELALMTMGFNNLIDCGAFTCDVNCGRGTDFCGSFWCGDNWCG